MANLFSFCQAIRGTWSDNANVLSCESAASVLHWITTFAVLCVFGLVCMGLGSVGNGQSSAAFHSILAMVFVTFMAIAPHAIHTMANVPDNPVTKFLRIVSTLLSCVVLAFACEVYHSAIPTCRQCLEKATR